MSRSRLALFLLLPWLVLGVLPASFGSTPEEGRQAGESSAVGKLMREQTVPASDAIFTAAGEPPATPADWQVQGDSLQQAARRLGSLSRQLARQRAYRWDSDWQHWAQAMRQAANNVDRAVRRRDGEALSAASEALYASCEGCHQRYLPRTAAASPDSPSP